MEKEIKSFEIQTPCSTGHVWLEGREFHYAKLPNVWVTRYLDVYKIEVLCTSQSENRKLGTATVVLDDDGTALIKGFIPTERRETANDWYMSRAIARDIEGEYHWHISSSKDYVLRKK